MSAQEDYLEENSVWVRNSDADVNQELTEINSLRTIAGLPLLTLTKIEPKPYVEVLEKLAEASNIDVVYWHLKRL